jgi:hypothetical protein
MDAVVNGVLQFPFDGVSGGLVLTGGTGYTVTLDFRGYYLPLTPIAVTIDADSGGDSMPTVNYAFTTDNAQLTDIQLVQIAQG